MNAQRVEKAMQVVSIAGIWLAFLAVWLSTQRYPKTWASIGSDLPAPTLLWISWAGNSAAFVVPAVLTIFIIRLTRSSSLHAGWFASAVLAFALFYSLISLTAVILPTFTMCGSI